MLIPVSGGSSSSWNMQIFTITQSVANTPTVFDLSKIVGQNASVPTIGFTQISHFRAYVPSTPDTYFSWRFFGMLRVSSAGSYTICSQSDDGSLVYIKMGAVGDSLLSDYTQVVNNDGIHGSITVCSSPLSLGSTSYNIMVRTHSLPITTHFERDASKLRVRPPLAHASLYCSRAVQIIYLVSTCEGWCRSDFLAILKSR